MATKPAFPTNIHVPMEPLAVGQHAPAIQPAATVPAPVVEAADGVVDGAADGAAVVEAAAPVASVGAAIATNPCRGFRPVTSATANAAKAATAATDHPSSEPC